MLEVTRYPPGRISGVVTLPDGSPASGVTVRAYKNGDGIFPSGGVVTTGSDGIYVPLPAFREWKIVFTPPAGSGLAQEWWDNKANRNVANPLVITTASEHYTANAQLG